MITHRHKGEKTKENKARDARVIWVANNDVPQRLSANGMFERMEALAWDRAKETQGLILYSQNVIKDDSEPVPYGKPKISFDRLKLLSLNGMVANCNQIKHATRHSLFHSSVPPIPRQSSSMGSGRAS